MDPPPVRELVTGAWSFPACPEGRDTGPSGTISVHVIVSIEKGATMVAEVPRGLPCSSPDQLAVSWSGGGSLTPTDAVDVGVGEVKAAAG